MGTPEIILLFYVFPILLGIYSQFMLIYHKVSIHDLKEWLDEFYIDDCTKMLWSMVVPCLGLIVSLIFTVALLSTVLEDIPNIKCNWLSNILRSIKINKSDYEL
jgi:hypothetical protein